MSFRLDPKSATLNDLERCNGPYFALFQRFFRPSFCVISPNFRVHVVAKQLLGLHLFQNLLLILCDHIKTICAIIQRLFGQKNDNSV